MALSLDTAAGLWLLGFTALVAAWMIAGTVRVSRRGNLLETWVILAFLPEKRRRYMTILAVEGSLLQLGALLWGATEAGLLPHDGGIVLATAFLSSAIGSMGALNWLGLTPTKLSPEARQALLRDAPQMLHSLAFAPLEVGEESRSVP